MHEILLYDCFLLMFYLFTSSYVCYSEGYNFKNKNLQKEIKQGIKGFLIQLPISNISLYTILPYTYIGDYWSIKNCFYYILSYDTIIFWFHWLMHINPYLYNKIHKKHHETLFVSPFSTTILDVKEDVITGVLPTIIPLFFLELNLTCWAILNMMIFVHGILIHSTKLLPYEKYLLGSKTHSIHHFAKGTNFGFIFPWWDKLLRTENKHMERRTIIKKIKEQYA